MPGSAIYQHVLHADGKIGYAYMSASIEQIVGAPTSLVMADPGAFRQLIVEEDRPRVLKVEAQVARDLPRRRRVSPAHDGK